MFWRFKPSKEEIEETLHKITPLQQELLSITELFRQGMAGTRPFVSDTLRVVNKSSCANYTLEIKCKDEWWTFKADYMCDDLVYGHTHFSQINANRCYIRFMVSVPEGNPKYLTIEINQDYTISVAIDGLDLSTMEIKELLSHIKSQLFLLEIEHNRQEQEAALTKFKAHEKELKQLELGCELGKLYL